MSENTRFDPRFDPAFQPGYEEGVTAKRPAGEVAPARLMAPEVSVQRPAITPVAAPAPPSPPSDATVEEPEPGRLNPFLIALAVAALLLIAAGVLVLSRTSELYASTSGQVQFDFITVQAMIYGAPILICLGLATGIGIIFVFALRWERKR